MMKSTYITPKETTAQPDILDLNDWAMVHAPESYAVAKYLNGADAFYDVLHAAWIAAGKPELQEATGC
jgi:hypothetical protein